MPTGIGAAEHATRDDAARAPIDLDDASDDLIADMHRDLAIRAADIVQRRDAVITAG